MTNYEAIKSLNRNKMVEFLSNIISETINYDVIEAMNQHELAEFLSNIITETMGNGHHCCTENIMNLLSADEDCSSENNNTHDAVNHPSHYCRDGIECIDVIKATTKGMNAFDAFCQGNAMKYLFRWQYKNGAQDLKKARWYIDKLIEIWDSPINRKKE